MTVTVESLNNEKAMEYKKRFFNVINRGGLSKPTDALYMATVHAQEFFDQLFRHKSIPILKFKNPRAVFLQAFKEKLSASRDTKPLSELCCKEGHNFSKVLNIVGTKIFNIGGQNYANDENSIIHATKAATKRKNAEKKNAKNPAAMKISKLQSDKL